MESLYLLIPLSVVLVAGAAALFFWAVNSGQYDDVDREGDRILFDDERLDDERQPQPRLEEPEGSQRPREDDDG